MMMMIMMIGDDVYGDDDDVDTCYSFTVEFIQASHVFRMGVLQNSHSIAWVLSGSCYRISMEIAQPLPEQTENVLPQNP